MRWPASRCSPPSACGPRRRRRPSWRSPRSPSPNLVVLRLALAAVALWLIVAVTGANARLRGVGWRPLLMGALEPGLVTLVVSLGLTMTSPVNGSVFWSLSAAADARARLPGVGRAPRARRHGRRRVWRSRQRCCWCGDRTSTVAAIDRRCAWRAALASAVNALLARCTAQAGANPLVTSCWQLTSACLVAALLLFLLPATGVARGGGEPAGAAGTPLSRPGGLRRRLYSVELRLATHAGGKNGTFSCLVGPVGIAISALLLGTARSAPADGVALAVVCWAPCCCHPSSAGAHAEPLAKPGQAGPGQAKAGRAAAKAAIRACVRDRPLPILRLAGNGGRKELGHGRGFAAGGVLGLCRRRPGRGGRWHRLCRPHAQPARHLDRRRARSQQRETARQHRHAARHPLPQGACRQRHHAGQSRDQRRRPAPVAQPISERDRHLRCRRPRQNHALFDTGPPSARACTASISMAATSTYRRRWRATSAPSC